MDKQALSDITVFNKYARFVKDTNRRESWEEIVTRNKEMHIAQYPNIVEEIENIYEEFVYTKKVLPSMRSLQFGGRPILMAENRIFNCAYAPTESVRFYSELMFLLLGGTGMGYSVQSRHYNKLPKIKTPESDLEYKFQIQDSIVGWSDAIKVVCKAFFNAGTLPVFDYRDIREKGEELITTGGKAPGPEPLRTCINNLIAVFRPAVGRRLTSVECHDIACIIADAVLAGGIRRAAMISLFDMDDERMLTCKSDNTPVKDIWADSVPDEKGMVLIQVVNSYNQAYTGKVHASQVDNFIYTKTAPWYIAYPYRARANNSAVLMRGEVTEKEFKNLMKRVEQSGCGEPGVYWTNNKDWGTNPCCEVALRPYQMCNLTEIHAGKIHTQEDFNRAARAAAFIGTLQAGYTDFHYLNPKWKIACEKEALLGVSMTGIASGTVEELDMEEAAWWVLEENRVVAELININPTARSCLVKPAGTTSLVLGTASGIHAWHAQYYIRRMRAGKNEALAQYMMRAVPELVEEDVTNSSQVVLSFPQKAPAGSKLRTEHVLELLERVKDVSIRWVSNGHVSGVNKHNVSCTISVKEDQWKLVANWMWDNREFYNGISVLPFYGSTSYPQMPFEDITEAQYLKMLPLLEGINIAEVYEENGDNVNLAAELACAGGTCEITF